MATHPPSKANVQRYICKYIDELKRNERAWILQLTNDIPDTQARCLVFFCQRSPFLLNLHLMISILKLISLDISPSWLVIHDLPYAFDSRFDSARAPWFPLWRALLGLHPDNRVSFSPVFFLPLLRLMAYGCLSFLFFQSIFLLDLCDLPLELVRVWPFYLFFFWFIVLLRELIF